MSTVRREWLLHGCLKLSDEPTVDHITRRIQVHLSEAYGGENFQVRLWPKYGYKHTVWWYEKSFKIPCVAASYFLITDNSRGPMLYAGVTVEKGLEDAKLARRMAAQRGGGSERWLLGKDWDWHRFISTWDHAQPVIMAASENLHRELYLWVEFTFEAQVYDSQYYIIRDGHLYWRGGFKPIQWPKVMKFTTRSHPKLWGNSFLA
jgi:hypothetical protein